MSKKHFKMLAEALRDSRPPKDHELKYRQWERDVDAVIWACRQFNTAFDTGRFWDAVNK